MGYIYYSPSGYGTAEKTAKRARLLLEGGWAWVYWPVPFTIRLMDRKQEDCALQPVRLKLDPSSKTTGVA